jgi:hypothetical protein
MYDLQEFRPAGACLSRLACVAQGMEVKRSVCPAKSSLEVTNFAATPLSLTQFDQPFLLSETQFGISEKVSLFSRTASISD